MTDRELLDILLSHLYFQQICVDEKDYVEIQNGTYGENIGFEFDENGKIINIFC